MPFINHKKKLKEALKIMNEKKLGIIVILKNNFIEGLVTDGDLRREIKNYVKDKNLNQLMSEKPLVVNENMPASKALGIMSENKITSLLVVSDKDYKKKNKKLKGIIHIHILLQNGIK
jgi:arabinose-5-phosphate isomerase